MSESISPFSGSDALAPLARAFHLLTLTFGSFISERQRGGKPFVGSPDGVSTWSREKDPAAFAVLDRVDAVHAEAVAFATRLGSDPTRADSLQHRINLAADHAGDFATFQSEKLTAETLAEALKVSGELYEVERMLTSTREALVAGWTGGQGANNQPPTLGSAVDSFRAAYAGGEVTSLALGVSAVPDAERFTLPDWPAPIPMAGVTCFVGGVVLDGESDPPGRYFIFWAGEQDAIKRFSRLAAVGGAVLCSREWAKRLGIKAHSGGPEVLWLALLLRHGSPEPAGTGRWVIRNLYAQSVLAGEKASEIQRAAATPSAIPKATPEPAGPETEFPPGQWVEPVTKATYTIGRRLLWQLWKALTESQFHLTVSQLETRVEKWRDTSLDWNNAERAIKDLRKFWKSKGRADLADRIKTSGTEGGSAWLERP